jgi:hypothetical protein
MKEEYTNLLTTKQLEFLENQLHRLGDYWVTRVRTVIKRGKYSDYEAIELNELGRLVKGKKNTIDNIII